MEKDFERISKHYRRQKSNDKTYILTIPIPRRKSRGGLKKLIRSSVIPVIYPDDLLIVELE